MMVHPSLIQKVSLDERIATRALKEEIKRCYLYVGPMSVGTHEATEPACNTMQMIIRLSKPYWKSSDPDGDALWGEVASWLKNKLYKVGSTMVNYNKSHAEKGEDTLTFGRLELEMKNVLFGFALPTVDELPAVDEQVACYRELLNAGVIGDDAVAVELPAKASWDAQWAAAVEAAEQEAARKAAEAEAAAQVEAAAQAEGAAEVESEQVEAGVEGETAGATDAPAEPAVDADAEGAEAAEGDQPAAEEPAEPELVVSLPVVDYSVWDVRFADGTVRQLDAVAGAWL